jgi:hypothetical protein
MNDRRGKILFVAVVIHLILLRLTWRDLGARPDAAVRGRKRLWRTWSLLNTTGSIAYWTFGRRRGQASETGGIETASE